MGWNVPFVAGALGGVHASPHVPVLDCELIVIVVIVLKK